MYTVKTTLIDMRNNMNKKSIDITLDFLCSDVKEIKNKINNILKTNLNIIKIISYKLLYSKDKNIITL